MGLAALCRQAGGDDMQVETLPCERGLSRPTAAPAAVGSKQHGGSSGLSQAEKPELLNIAMLLARDGGSTATSRSEMTPQSSRSRHRFYGVGQCNSEEGTSPPPSARSVFSTFSDAKQPDADASKDSFVPKIIVAEGDWEVHIARTVEKRRPGTPSTVASTPPIQRGMSRGMGTNRQMAKSPGIFPPGSGEGLMGGGRGSPILQPGGASGSRGAMGRGSGRIPGIGQSTIPRMGGGSLPSHPGGGGSLPSRPRGGRGLGSLGQHMDGDSEDDQPLSEHDASESEDIELRHRPGPGFSRGVITTTEGAHSSAFPDEASSQADSGDADVPAHERPTNLFAGITSSTTSPSSSRIATDRNFEQAPRIAADVLDIAVDRALQRPGGLLRHRSFGSALEADALSKAADVMGTDAEQLSNRLLKAYAGIQAPRLDTEEDSCSSRSAPSSSNRPLGRCPPRNRTMKRGASGAPIRSSIKVNRLQGISEDSPLPSERQASPTS